jgi:hypothetical protein
MPLLTEDELKKSYGLPQIPNDNPELKTPQFNEALGAAFRLENTVGSALVDLPYKEHFSREIIDREFDLTEKLEEYDLVPYADSFTEVFNDEQFDRQAQKLEGELKDREILANSGWRGFAANVVAGTFDPINLVPVGGVAVKGMKAKSFLQASISTAKVAAPSIALQESLLNATQETRTLGESVVNIGAGTVLAGTLGGSLNFLGNAGKNFDDITSRFEKDLVKDTKAVETAEKEFYSQLVEGNSVGAAAKFETTLKHESLAPSFGFGEATSNLVPSLRLAKSPIKSVREFSQKLIDNPMFFNKNFEGIETPLSVENLRFEQDVRSAKIRTSFRDFYKAHNKNAGEGQKLNKKEFNEAVSYAMRNGDVGASDAISEAAKRLRNDVIEPLKNDAIGLGLLPEDVNVSTADSYLTRLWSKEKIVQDLPRFREIMKDHFIKKSQQIRRQDQIEFQTKIDKIKGQIAKSTGDKLDELNNKLSQLEFNKRAQNELFDDVEAFEDYINDLVNDIQAKLTGTGRAPLAFEVTIADHGPLKDRTLDIMDNEVQDFLENDAEMVLEIYNRDMTGQTLLQEQFGTIKFEDAFQDIQREFNDYIPTVPKKDQKKALKKFKQDTEDMEMLWDLTNGTYRSTKNPDKAFVKGLADIRTLNYMRLLGGVTISSLADAGSLVMSHGFKNVFGDLLVPTIKNMGKIKPVIGEMKDAGIVLESLLNSRIQAYAEISDPTARGTYFSRMLNNMSTFFTQATMITTWNDTMKASAGILVQSKTLRNASKFLAKESISEKDLAELKWMGLSDADLMAIAKEYKKHGSQRNGIYLSGAENWENQSVARRFRAALNKNVNATIVTKGLGDVPSFANTELGKSFLQFQSFSFAANQRITIRNAQRMAKGDLAVLQGVSSMIAMGMLVAYLKAEGHKEGTTDSWTTDKWIMEGVDRSGIIPVAMMFNNPWERVGMPGISRGLAGITGNDAQPVSRYAARGTAEALLGPTMGTIGDTSLAIHSAASGELSESDIHRFRKLLPYQNLIGIRGIFDQAEEQIKDNAL